MQGPLQCSEAQVATYERAITLSTQLVVVAHSVPDAYITPSTDILRRLVAPAREHIAALDSGTPLIWDRPRIESTVSPAILQAALDASLVRSSSPPPPAWTPLLGSAPSMHGAGAVDSRSLASHSAASGRRRQAPIPHVHGITASRGPPLQLDAAKQQRMRQKFIEMLRSSPSAQQPYADSAAEAPPGAAAAAAAAAGGRTGGSSADLALGPSRAGSLASAGSASSAMHVQPVHGSRGLPGGPALPLPQAPRAESYHELPGDGGSAPRLQPDLPPPAPGLQVQFEPGRTLPASRPGMRREPNALCGPARWEPQPQLPFHGDSAPGPLGWQFLSSNRAPGVPLPRGDPLYPQRPFGFADGSGPGIKRGYHGWPSVEDPMVPAPLVQGGMYEHLPLPGELPLGGPGGRSAAPGAYPGAPAVPPQDMAKLMFRLAQQLGYPPQRMQEVVSCMQQDCRQPGPSW